MLTQKAVTEFMDYLSSGRWEEDFGYRTPDGQAEMLYLIEGLFALCEKADEVLTRALYARMAGAGDQAGGGKKG
ncbi:MAG: hypothetical protein K6360_08885 [Deltaproteobacteria bacterium]